MVWNTACRTASASACRTALPGNDGRSCHAARERLSEEPVAEAPVQLLADVRVAEEQGDLPFSLCVFLPQLEVALAFADHLAAVFRRQQVFVPAVVVGGIAERHDLDDDHV